MPYMDRLNRVCGFLDVEEKENTGRFHRRYFILDTHNNTLVWYMDNPQNLPSGASSVGSLRLTYISKVSEATLKQKPKTEFCFVINALSRRFYLQANDPTDMKDWVAALNNATKITVPKADLSSDVATVTSEGGKKQLAYRAEIIGGVVVHTPIHNQHNDGEESEERRVPRPGVLRCGYCVKQGNVRKSWKRRFFTLDNNAVSYYKCETDKEPLRAVLLRDIQKVHECLVKSGDLLMRDNLFEIITSSRIFYVQTDSPEDMHGWIRDIQKKIQDFNPKPFMRRPGCALQGRPPLLKSYSVAPGWQPWTAVPQQRDASALGAQEYDSPFTPLPAMPCHSSTSSSSSSSSLSSSSTSLSVPAACPGGLPPAAVAAPAGQEVSDVRRRHRSQPQTPRTHSFPFSLDDDGIRTTDV